MNNPEIHPDELGLEDEGNIIDNDDILVNNTSEIVQEMWPVVEFQQRRQALCDDSEPLSDEEPTDRLALPQLRNVPARREGGRGERGKWG